MCSVNDKNCSLCAVSEEAEFSSEELLSGMPLSFSSFIVFILPVLFALLGVLFAGNNEFRQILGAFTGFMFGVVTAKLLTKRKVKAR